MIQKLYGLLFEPRYPARYVGRHRLSPRVGYLLQREIAQRNLGRRVIARRAN